MLEMKKVPVHMPRVRSNHGNQKSNLLKVILLGNGGVGKSCLMNRFVNNAFMDDSYHTVGVEFLNKFIETDGKKYCLQIWDTAGQERYKSLRTPFYRGSDICILTYSIIDHSSFDELLTWKCEFLKYANITDIENFPFVIIGNKCDMPEDRRQVTKEEADIWCMKNGFFFIETSAKSATNVEEAFHLALQKWVATEAKLDRSCDVPSVALNNPPRKTCC